MSIESEIAQQVALKLTERNASIRQAVITFKVDEALNHRKSLALATLANIADYQRRLAAMEQDVLFDSDGKTIFTGFNAKQNADREKYKKEIERMEALLANALGEKADWSGLEK
jgi:hypothetical protein